MFSESKETTTYLLGRMTQAGYKRVLTVSSENRAERMPLVRANFDANFKEQANDYDILISTEVLAEGVNLHRANVIVNYDTPWNSTRLMQRVGRVNRIGSVAPNIYIYNFYPTAKVDDDIELKKKAIMKLQAFHTALGEDSQITPRRRKWIISACSSVRPRRRSAISGWRCSWSCANSATRTRRNFAASRACPCAPVWAGRTNRVPAAPLLLFAASGVTLLPRQAGRLAG